MSLGTCGLIVAALTVQGVTSTVPTAQGPSVIDRISMLPEPFAAGDGAWHEELTRLRRSPAEWPALAQALSSTDEKLAYRIAEIFEKLGRGWFFRGERVESNIDLSPIVPVVLKTLADRDLGRQARAARVIGAIGAPAAAAVPALMRMLEDTEDDRKFGRRMVAAEALGGIGPPAKAAIPLLRRVYGEPDFTLRMSAQRALISIAGVTSVPSTPPPGAIELLPGWSHRQEQGIDTLVGTMWRADGLEIGYDIGFLAGGHAADTGRPLLWTKKQIVHGYSVQITLRPNRYLEVLFFDGLANFSAEVKTEQDLAEVLLIVLSYHPGVSRVLGVYSNSTPDAAPTALTMEVTLGYGTDFYATVQMEGPGAPALPVIVPVARKENRVEFTVTVEGKPLRFDGELQVGRLVGTFGSRPIVLRQVGGK